MWLSELIAFTPGLYLTSRLLHHRAWRQRRRFFLCREPLASDDWARLGGPEHTWEPRLVAAVLRQIEENFAIPGRFLRPSDRFYAELKLPDRKLQDRMMSECIDAIEYMLGEECEIEKAPVSTEPLEELTVGTLMEQAHYIWTNLRVGK